MQEDYTKNTEKVNKAFVSFYDFLECFVYAIVAVCVLFLFIARLSVVVGSSMDDTLKNGDYLVVVDPLFTYSPDNGDIVVIDGGQQFAPYTDPIVKRVIATSGQTLIIDFKNEAIYVDGIMVDEAYAKYVNRYSNKHEENYTLMYHKHLFDNDLLLSSAVYDWQEGTFTVTIPEDHIFVMGDNRLDSADSRFNDIGFVHKDFVVGKAVFRLLPFSKIGGI